MKRLLVLLALLSSVAYGQLRHHELQDLPNQSNYLKNGGFERFTLGWTASGGSVSFNTTDFYDGTQAGVWNPSADAQTLKTDAVAPSEGLRGKACLAKFEYKLTGGTAGDYTVKISDGVSVGITQALDLAVSSEWQTASMGFICPSSGNMQLELAAVNGSTATDLIIDGAWLGSDYRIGAPVPQLNGFISYTPIYYSDAGITKDKESFYYKENGDGTIDLKITFRALSNGTTDDDFGLGLPPQFTINPSFYPLQTYTGASCRYRNATNDYAFCGVFLDTTNENKIQLVADGSAAILHGNEVGTSGGKIDLVQIFVPSVVVNELSPMPESVTLATQGWMVDVNIGGSGQTNLTTGNITTYAPPANANLDMVINSGSANAGIPCNGGLENAPGDLTCSGQNEQIGLIVDVPYSGYYQVCTSFTNENHDNTTTWQLIETPNDDDTTFNQLGGSRIASRASNGPQNAHLPVHLCGTFNLTAGKKTIRLMRTQSSTSTEGKIFTDRSASAGERDVHLTMYPLTQNFSQAVALTDLVADSVAACTSEKEFCSGTYTPTVTNLNCTSVSNSAAFQFMKVGRIVSVTGRLTSANCDAGDTFKFSPPITPSANFGGESRGVGHATWNANDADNTGTCKAFTGETNLAVQRRSATTGNASVFITCQYQLD